MIRLRLSKKAINDLIIFPEVSDENNYNLKLQKPIWPGGTSGITIGLGYDLGHQSPDQIEHDLQRIINDSDISKLKSFAGIIGIICKRYLPVDIIITWNQAQQIFYSTSLKRYSGIAARIYDELETLHPYEQTAIIGLIYNRGGSLKDKPGEDRRREMNLLIQAIKLDDDKQMSLLIRSMKRLWKNQGLNGLINRRELEAQYIEKQDLPIPGNDELILDV
jgi:hypothetical protein